MALIQINIMHLKLVICPKLNSFPKIDKLLLSLDPIQELLKLLSHGSILVHK